MEEVTNIGQRILAVLKEKGVKPTPFEERKEISRGYFKKVSESGTSIGTDIVEKFLLEFPDVDAYWVITGHRKDPKTGETGENHTAATKSDEAAVNEERKKHLAELEAEVKYLRLLTSQQSEVILNLSRTVPNQG